MDISAVIKKLNKELGTSIPSGYYSKIRNWRNWWRGSVPSFHRYREVLSNGNRRWKELYSLKMAKKICEDWAAILLNEKTKITLDDKATHKWLQGENEVGGILGQIDFWTQANALVEKTFYSGTGAFVLKIDRMGVTDDGSVIPSGDTRMRMEYLPAMNIIPLSRRYGTITEAAFVSEATERGSNYIYLETHTIENGLYVIKNRYFKDNNGALEAIPLPAGVAEIVHTGSPVPFFSIMTPNTVNPHRHNLGLGCSVFSQAIDNLKGVDLTFNNFCQDFWLGGKKVFYDRSLIEQRVDAQGEVIDVAPDEIMQQLFMSVGDGIMKGDNRLMHEFNPTLRVTENAAGIQAQLDYLSFKCGMGTRYYKFDSNKTTAVTATQYTGEKQELKQNAAKHSIIIEQALIDIIRAMLWVGKNIIGADISVDANIAIEFSDGYIISDEERRAQDLRDIDMMIMQPWEYRVKWYGDDEATARERTRDKTISDGFGADT